MKTSTKVLAGLTLLLSASSVSLVQAAPASVSDPVLFGGASLGYNGAVSGSALQGSRHYPHGPDPLKGRYVWADVDWVIVVHPTHHHHHHHM